MKVAFFKGNDGIIDTLIKWWTNSNYSHVELVVGDKWISSHPTEGVRYKDASEMNLEDWDFVEINTIVYPYMEEILEWFIGEQLGAKYDFGGIFLSQVFRLGYNSDSQWFCSEIVTKFLQILLVREVLDLQPNKVSPQGLYEALASHNVE